MRDYLSGKVLTVQMEMAFHFGGFVRNATSFVNEADESLVLNLQECDLSYIALKDYSHKLSSSIQECNYENELKARLLEYYLSDTDTL